MRGPAVSVKRRPDFSRRFESVGAIRRGPWFPESEARQPSQRQRWMLALEHSIEGGPGLPSEIDALRRFRTSHRLYAYAELVLSLPLWWQGLPRARHPDP